MKIKRIAHLGIAVKDLDPPKKIFCRKSWLEVEG